MLGMGAAGNWPTAVKVVAEWFPAKERALATGLFNSGSAIGAVVAPPLVAWIILKSGWRGFDIAAVGKFAWIAFAAGAGNLLGGACAAALPKRGISVTWARKISSCCSER